MRLWDLGWPELPPDIYLPEVQMGNGDIYKRKQIEQDAYQCGCRWERWPGVGDVLVQCPIHQAHTTASVEQFEREREKKVPNAEVTGA